MRSSQSKLKTTSGGYGHNGWGDHGLTITAVRALPKRELIAAAEPASVMPGSPLEPTPRVLSDQALAGKAIFDNQAQPGCGVCHSLAASDVRGVVGPNLDTLKPGLAQLRNAITQGVGAMPAYGGQLSPVEIDALAAYVFEASQ